MGEALAELARFAALPVFGALLTPRLFRGLSLGGYAAVVLSIVLVRPASPLISLIGPRFGRREKPAAAWFGPKRFASVVYGLLVLRAGIPEGRPAYTLIAVCIAFSIVARGSTDVPVARSSTWRTSPATRTTACRSAAPLTGPAHPTPRPRLAHRRQTMRARDLAEEYPSVTTRTDALDAARLLAEQRLPGVLVMDDGGEPYAILPASRLLRMLVPGYVLEDPTLASVVDEPHADRICAALAGRSVGDCLPRERTVPPVADPDDTALDLAALMARERSPLVAVVERGPERGTARLLGVITASHLLERLLEVR